MTERQRLEKTLDETISRIVRRRDLGYGCITCGRALTYETSTAGHFMHRSHRGTRWSVVNVNGQCWKCNAKDDTKLYEKKMRRKYGDKTVDRIMEVAHSNVKLSNNDLRELLRELKQYESQLKNGYND